MSASLVVLVTGAGSGIGRATAHEYAKRGARLVLASRAPGPLQEASVECSALGAADVLVVPTDVTDSTAVDDLVAAAVRRYGRLDVAVHAAAVVAYAPMEEVPLETFQRVLDVNVVGTLRVARSVLRQLRAQEDGGALVLLSSLLGRVAVPELGPYVVSKWAVRGLVRVLQLETRDAPQVRVRAVSPAGVDTPVYLQGATHIGRHGRPPVPVSTPQAVARTVVRAAQGRRGPRRELAVGVAHDVVALGSALVPPVYDLLVGPLMRLGGLGSPGVPATDGNVFEPVPEREGTHGAWPRGVRRLRSLLGR